MSDVRPQDLSAPGLLAPLRHRGFRRLVAGQVLSTLGDMVFAVSLPFVVLRMGDAKDLAVMLTLLGVGRVAGAPLGGLLADRWSPRNVMLVADLGRAGVLVLLVAATGPAGGLPALGAGIVLLGLLEGVFLPAYWAIMPTLLDEEELAGGNAVSEALMVTAAMAGPLVGGLAMASLSTAAVLAVNAATFLVSAGTLLAVRARRAAPAAAPAGTGFWAFARRSRLLVAVLVMAALSQLTSTAMMNVALPIYLDRHFDDGQRVYGLMLGAQGGGLLLGTLAAGLVWRLPRRGYLALGLLVVDGLVLTAFPRLPGLLAPLSAMVVLGLAAGVLSVVALTLVQRISPAEILGRVMAAFTAVTIAAFPIAAVLIGVIVARQGPESAFLVGGIGVLAVSVIGAAQRAIRNA
ncbi:MFS transporter [Nonomuraea sp. WAC 01424]|uniref:MFS transporter n=1 Tax=Nonomuraea sp. WAC 01424 TaxID=2203200 RepID=UPI00163CBA57|nr:MFS transporter [Nonomuraea sp. WAC 01424]